MTFCKALIEQLSLDKLLPSGRPDVAIALNAGVLRLQNITSNKLLSSGFVGCPSTAVAVSVFQWCQ